MRDEREIAQRTDDMPRVVRRDDTGAVAEEMPARDEPVIVHREPVVVSPARRGVVSLGSVVTGMLVAVGAFVIFSAVAGALIVDMTTAGGVDTIDTPTSFGLAAGIGFVVAQLLAYMWGGYAAGRMARTHGTMHGLLVPVAWLLIGGITAAVVAAMGYRADLNMPFGDARFAVDPELRGEVAIGLGVVTILAMLIGGMLGGMLGERWHRRAERRAMASQA